MERRAAAVDRLQNYELMRTAVENLRTQIRLLKLTRESIPGVRTDRVAVQRSCDSADHWLVENLTQLQELETALEQTLLWIMVTDRALGVLDPEELGLLRLFYIKKTPGALSLACQLLEAEKSTVYRKRDRALAKFTTALFGAQQKEPVAG